MTCTDLFKWRGAARQNGCGCGCPTLERCGLFVVSTESSTPPSPTIVFSGLSYSFTQGGAVVCADGHTCSSSSFSCDASAINGTYSGLTLQSSVGDPNHLISCTWKISPTWSFGSSNAGCGATTTNYTGGTLTLVVNPGGSGNYCTAHQVKITLSLTSNMPLYTFGGPGSIHFQGNLAMSWDTGLFDVPARPGSTPTIPALSLVSSNLPASATSFSGSNICGSVSGSNTAGNNGSVSLSFA